MSLTQAQQESLTKRHNSKWEKVCDAVDQADDRIREIKGDVLAKKQKLQKLSESLATAKGVRNEKVEAKKALA